MNQNDSGIFINRELSWLEFNSRVLELAKNKENPLAEQLNFAGIFASNLDEFFMIRVGSLYDQTLLKEEKRENKTGMTPTAQLHAIMPVVRSQQTRCDKILAKLFVGLSEYGFEKVDFDKLSKEEEHRWKKYFLEELYPVLSPQIIDRRHPFPFLRNLDIYVGARVKTKNGGADALGIIPISNQFDRIIYSVRKNGTVQFALVEELVVHYAEEAFGHYAVSDKGLFRVTRNADINMEEAMLDHDIDYREVMRELLKKRRKLAAVRLQLSSKTSPELLALLCNKLVLNERHCFLQTAPLDMSFVRNLSSRLAKSGLSKLFYASVRPLLPPQDFSLTKAVQEKDLLIVYPYQSIRPFVNLLWDAANDPTVISIKMTLYRMASESQIIEALVHAAENGKEVVTIVELRARFDEQNNIDWSKELESAGCTVIYGFEDYKVHSKLMLITRKAGDQYHYISQIGTGNYNEKTAELYTDLCFVSANQALGEEVATVFNDLAVERRTTQTTRLLVAPYRFKSVLLDEINTEIEAKKQGLDARIVIKCNSVSDRDIILKLSDAS
ncbi:MAG: polyphosphate kinase 1, partial [Pygmaiobacter sp.]